jgi:hypothetical protein
MVVILVEGFRNRWRCNTLCVSCITYYLHSHNLRNNSAKQKYLLGSFKCVLNIMPRYGEGDNRSLNSKLRNGPRRYLESCRRRVIDSRRGDRRRRRVPVDVSRGVHVGGECSRRLDRHLTADAPNISITE